MAKLAVLLTLVGLLCLTTAQETTNLAEKVEETTTVMPTRPTPQASTTLPPLVHKINETMENATAEAEKNVQKNDGGRGALNAALATTLLVLCAWF